MGLRARINAIVEWAKNSRVGRTLAWFNACNGSQLCAGIAYLSLFSLFAILTVGWSAFSASLGNYPGLKEAVLAQINSWIPGLIGVEEGYLVSPDQLIIANALNWASLVAIFVGPYWIFRVMTALRTAVCRVCAVSRRAGNVLWDQSTKFLGFVIMAIGVVLSAITTIATEHFGTLLVITFGVRVSEEVNLVMGVISTLLGALINAIVMIGVIRLIARVWFASAHKRRELWVASLLGGLLLAVLRWLGTSLFARSALGNPLLAPFVAIVTILVLADFTVRVLLLICAWVYDPPRLDSPRPIWLIKPRHPQSLLDQNITEVSPFTPTSDPRPLTGEIPIFRHPIHKPATPPGTKLGSPSGVTAPLPPSPPLTAPLSPVPSLPSSPTLSSLPPPPPVGVVPADTPVSPVRVSDPVPAPWSGYGKPGPPGYSDPDPDSSSVIWN